jgi:putative transposase
VLDILVQKGRSKRAAKRFLPQAAQERSLCPAHPGDRSSAQLRCREARDSAECCASCCEAHDMNDRAENSHQAVRRRKSHLQRFKSMRHAQRFCSTFSSVCNQFRPGRHTLSAKNYRVLMRGRLEGGTKSQKAKYIRDRALNQSRRS